MGGELGALQKAALSLNTEKLDDKSSSKSVSIQKS